MIHTGDGSGVDGSAISFVSPDATVGSVHTNIRQPTGGDYAWPTPIGIGVAFARSVINLVNFIVAEVVGIWKRGA